MSDEILFKTYRIPPSLFPTVIPSVEHYLREAVETTDGRFNITDTVDGLLLGLCQLWVCYGDKKPSAVAITEINVYPRFKTVNIVSAAGRDRSKWLESSLGEIEQWGIEMGAERIEITARQGWVRSMKPLGYRRTHVMLEKGLHGEESKESSTDSDNGAVGSGTTASEAELDRSGELAQQTA